MENMGNFGVNIKITSREVMGVVHGSLLGIGFSGKGLKLNGGMVQQPKFDNPRGSGYNNVIDRLALIGP